MADLVTVWVQNWFKNHSESEMNKHLIVCGKTDTGKTETANRIFQFLKHARFTAMEVGGWITPPVIEQFDFQEICVLEDEAFRQWLKDREQTTTLFLDDIGSEVDRFKTGTPTERLRQIFEMFKNRYIYATSNIMASGFEKKWDDRVASRLLRNSEVVELVNCPKWNVARI